MNLHDMQDLLNDLGARFKVFTSTKDHFLVLRVFFDETNKEADHADITYSIRGEYVPEPVL